MSSSYNQLGVGPRDPGSRSQAALQDPVDDGNQSLTVGTELEFFVELPVEVCVRFEMGELGAYEYARAGDVADVVVVAPASASEPDDTASTIVATSVEVTPTDWRTVGLLPPLDDDVVAVATPRF